MFHILYVIELYDLCPGTGFKQTLKNLEKQSTLKKLTGIIIMINAFLSFALCMLIIH